MKNQVGKATRVRTGGVREAMGLLAGFHCLEAMRAEVSEREGWQDRIALAEKFSPGDKRRDGHSESSLARVNT